jgi:hypothetical protein
MDLAVLVRARGRPQTEREAQLAQRHHDAAVVSGHAKTGRFLQHQEAADGVDDVVEIEPTRGE